MRETFLASALTAAQSYNVAERLHRLERANRWWKGLGSSAVAFLGLIFFLGAMNGEETRIADEIRTKRFTIVDDKGQIRIELGAVHRETLG